MPAQSRQPDQDSPDRSGGRRHRLGVHPHQWRPFIALPGPSLRRHAFPDNLEATLWKRLRS